MICRSLPRGWRTAGSPRRQAMRHRPRRRRLRLYVFDDGSTTVRDFLAGLLQAHGLTLPKASLWAAVRLPSTGLSWPTLSARPAFCCGFPGVILASESARRRLLAQLGWPTIVRWLARNKYCLCP